MHVQLLRYVSCQHRLYALDDALPPYKPMASVAAASIRHFS